MIHLDTNVLIALPHLIRQDHPFIARIAQGEDAAVCVPVWYEYLIGPLNAAEKELARQFIRGDICAVEAEDAATAARLFNHVGRKRGLKTDALIAAVALRRQAEFFTLNVDDFLPFASHGLRLLRAS